VIFIPSFLSSSALEPPCRQRRLEPFRQNIRDSCRTETSFCPRHQAIDDIETLDVFPADVRGLLGPSAYVPLLPLDQSFDQLFDDMMGQSLKMFDAMLALDGLSSSSSMSLAEPTSQEIVAEEIPAVNKAEEAAEQALDIMVTSLFSRTGSDETEKQDMAQRLSQLGEELMTHRRLSEQSASDPHAAVEQRLARRLTEYSVDLFYHPDGTVTLYTASIPSKDYDQEVPVLGMGSKHLDSCIVSQYNNRDLQPTCETALDMFFMAQQTPGLMYDQFEPSNDKRTLDPETFDTIAQALERHSREAASMQSQSDAMEEYYISLAILLTVYTLVAFVGLCTGLVDVSAFVMGFFVSITVAALGIWTLIVVIPSFLLVGAFISSNEDDEEESDEIEAYDYVKLPDDDGVADMKQAETLVFVGVPVQVV
jgi:hypothetical protein